MRFSDALGENERFARELSGTAPTKSVHEPTGNLVKDLTVIRSARTTVRAEPRVMVKRMPRRSRSPPHPQQAAGEPVAQQAQAPGEAWTVVQWQALVGQNPPDPVPVAQRCRQSGHAGAIFGTKSKGGSNPEVSPHFGIVFQQVEA